MFSSGRLFELAALPYDLLTRHAIWERHCAAMARELPAGARKVLDLGCGPGNSTTHLRDAVGKGAIGADVSPAMVRRARARDGRLTLLCADGSLLPFRTGSLDGVTLHSVLYLLPDRQRALAEIARVLRPGGRAVLLEPQEGLAATAGGLLRALTTPRWAVTALCWRIASAAYGRFSSPGLADVLTQSGLRVLTISQALGGLGLLAVAEKPRGPDAPGEEPAKATEL